MLDAYMGEILAVVAVLAIVIAIYIFTKKSKNTPSDIQEEQSQKISQDEIKKEDTEEQKTEIQKETEVELQEEKYVNIDALNGKEEGSFGEIDSTENIQTKTENESQKQPQQNKLLRNKRVVPPHAKITKEDFKEFSGKRILVAEDNMINQKVISGLLADTGIELVMADDGQIALDILQKDSNFQFILMDAHMPRIDGFEATRLIRQNPAYNHIVIVALSGDTAADDIKKMSDAGMEEHLEKPLRMDALYDILYTYADNQPQAVQTAQNNELDIDEGIAICGDDEEFYNEILEQFTNTYSNSSSEIENMLKRNDIEKARQYLLDISGIAANIGATNIAKISSDLRESLKNPKDSSYLELFKRYSKSLVNLLDEIKAYKN